ncbi:MAG: hypothetical protein OSA97_05785 [Nevskia sp.]|nr:hypothetical protein [Nevskia sp.]
MPISVMALVAVSLLAACQRHSSSQDSLKQALDAAQAQSAQQATTDPARHAHPDDPNPLRRKLGDLEIRELFFGPTQTRGDWMAYLPCSQNYFGMPVAGPNRIYLKRCPALEQYLLGKARGAGFADAALKDVLDPRVSGAQRP